MSASPDRFSRHFQKQQERRRLTDEVVDPDAPPLPDDPIEPAKKSQAVGRNDACPCGSGKKYKKCCGKNA